MTLFGSPTTSRESGNPDHIPRPRKSGGDSTHRHIRQSRFWIPAFAGKGIISFGVISFAAALAEKKLTPRASIIGKKHQCEKLPFGRAPRRFCRCAARAGAIDARDLLREGGANIKSVCRRQRWIACFALQSAKKIEVADDRADAAQIAAAQAEAEHQRRKKHFRQSKKLKSRRPRFARTASPPHKQSGTSERKKHFRQKPPKKLVARNPALTPCANRRPSPRTAETQKTLSQRFANRRKKKNLRLERHPIDSPKQDFSPTFRTAETTALTPCIIASAAEAIASKKTLALCKPPIRARSAAITPFDIASAFAKAGFFPDALQTAEKIEYADDRLFIAAAFARGFFPTLCKLPKKEGSYRDALGDTSPPPFAHSPTYRFWMREKTLLPMLSREREPFLSDVI